MDNTPPRLDWHRLVAVAVFVVAAALIAALIWQDEQARREVERHRVADLAGIQTRALQQALENALVTTYALAELVRQSQGTIPDFTAVAEGLLPHSPGAEALCLAPGGILQAVYPLAGSEGDIGRDLLLDPALSREARQTLDKGRLTLAGPIEMSSGRLALVGRLPVFLPDDQGQPRFWGFTIARLPWPAAIAPVGLHRLAEQGYDYVLWRTHPDTGAPQVLAASGSSPLTAPVAEVVPVANATWTLELAPAAGWGDPPGLLFRSALGLGCCLLLAWLARLLVQTRAQARQLAALVEERTTQSEERFRRLLDEVPAVAVQGYLQDGTIRYWNPASERLYGYSAPEAIGRNLLDLIIPPELGDAFRDAVARMALTGENQAPSELLLLRRDGSRVPVFASHAVVRIPDRAPEFFGIGIDLTESRRFQEALRASEARFRQIVETTNEGIWIINRAGITTFTNRQMEILLGYPPGGLIGRPFYDFMAEADRREAEQRLDERLQGVAAQHEFRFIRADGHELWTLISTTPLLTSDGEVGQALAMVSDITERKRVEEEVRQLAWFDVLTGLPNRRLLLDRLRQALATSARTRRRGALMFIDLDHFKAVNDNLGHDLGDLLLQEFAQRLRRCVRACDTVARLGGDEFVILLEGLAEDLDQAERHAQTVGENLLAACASPFELATTCYLSTCSIGISLFVGLGEDAEWLLKRADRAMYQAKAAGRNTLFIATPINTE